MKNLSHKSALIFAGVLAVCAFAVPSTASAASWASLGTHQLFSPNLSSSFTIPALGTFGWSCADTEFDAEVVNAQVIEITGAAFRSCTGGRPPFGTPGNDDCTLTATGLNFPWTATARLTTDIQIHRVDVTLIYDTTPGGTTCSLAGAQARLTGTLTGGSFDPSPIGANRRLTLRNPTGLTAHLLGTGVNSPATVTGDIRDTTGTLNVVD
jgi:hypothetical protein